MEPFEERRWARLTRLEGNCLIWIGPRNKKGYGVMRLGSKRDGTRRQVTAHRAAFEHFIGALAPGDCVLHHCDNPPCVGFWHLFKGDRRLNFHDALSKGRMLGAPHGAFLAGAF